jgi:hypothetical protein
MLLFSLFCNNVFCQTHEAQKTEFVKMINIDHQIGIVRHAIFSPRVNQSPNYVFCRIMPISPTLLVQQKSRKRLSNFPIGRNGIFQ